jgi:eukaryotic-like serine/threonine-protein kinase
MASDFGFYQILSEIGRGGMGIVYQARDTRDQQIVAIKQLVLSNINASKEQEFRDRFKREAATAQRLQHPHIVKVFDVSTDSENYFYVMEYLKGKSLRHELEARGGRMTSKEFWPVLAQVVEGLSFAHSMNVVHRDVKPDNIFILDDGTVKVTDFGIARVAEFEETHLTKTGVMMGTLAYVSPEQLQDAKNVDHRADIFSLGVVT